MKGILWLPLLCSTLIDTNFASSPHVREKRTIGGSQFERGRWPWLALLRATVVTDTLFGFIPTRHYHLYCGGVLVSRRWILTAAHCFTEDRHSGSPGNWEARLGVVRLRPSASQRIMDVVGRILDVDDLRQWDMDVETIVVHPGYNSSNMYSNDIALVKLRDNIPRSNLIQAINLPSTLDYDFPVEGQSCITKGWGCTSRGGEISHRAREIEMPIYPSRMCSYHFGIPNSRRRLCAGYFNRGIGVCNGDSGSPLVCVSNGRFTLAGVVSFASRNRPASFPAVFTRVWPYLPWIHDVIERSP